MWELISDIFVLILAGGFIVDLIRAMNDDLCSIREIPCDNQPVLCHDEFDLLYINVADGDSEDYDYWLAGLKAGENDDTA